MPPPHKTRLADPQQTQIQLQRGLSSSAAALFTRLAVVKLEGGDPPADMVKWLDKVHIGLMQV